VLHSKLDTRSWPDNKVIITQVGEIVGMDGGATVSALEAEEKARQAAHDAMTPEKADEFVADCIKKHPVFIFSKSFCPFCAKAKKALRSVGAHFQSIELDLRPDGDRVQEALVRLTGQKTVPNVFINGQSIGGGSETEAMAKTGELVKKLGALGSVVTAPVTLRDVDFTHLTERTPSVIGDPSSEKSSRDVKSDADPVLPEKPFLPLFLNWPFFFFPYNINLTNARFAAAANVVFALLIGILTIAETEAARIAAAALAADFLLRIIFGGRGSIAGIIGDIFAHYYPVKITPGAPKQFAQMVGFMCTVIPALLLNTGDGIDGDARRIIAAVFLWMLAIFAFLESAFNFCAGCWMFKILVRSGAVGVDPSIKSDKIAHDSENGLNYLRERKDRKGEPNQVILNSGEHRIPLVYKQKDADFKKDDFNVIKHCSITLYGWQMGMVGLTICWKVAHELLPAVSKWVYYIVGIISVTTFACVSILYLIKWFMYPKKVKKEWLHPQQGNFFAAIPLCINGYAFVLVASDFSRFLWWFGAVGSMLVSVILLSRWIRRPIYRGHVMPVWMIAPVGNLLCATTARELFVGEVSYDILDAAYLWFSVGTFMYLILLVMSLQRLFFGAYTMEKLRTTTMIYIAAPAVLAAADVSINNAWSTLSLSAYYFSWFNLMIVISLGAQGYLSRYRFNMSYWAYSFPMAALTLVTMYHAYVNPFSPTSGSFTLTTWQSVLAWGMLSVTTFWTVLLLIHTVHAIVAEEGIFTPEPKFGPMGACKITNFALEDALNKLEQLGRKLHRPNQRREFCELWHQIELTYNVRDRQQVTILFPQIEEFFPRVTQPIRKGHDQLTAIMNALTNMVNQTAPAARANVFLRVDPGDPEFISLKKAANDGIDSDEKANEPAVDDNGDIALDVVADTDRVEELSEIQRQQMHQLVVRIKTAMMERIDYEQENLTPIISKHFNGKLQKELSKKLWKSLPARVCRIIVPFVINSLVLHKRRVMYLKAWQMSMPERMQLLGQYVYQGVDDIMWDRLRVDVPEMIPRHLDGYEKYF
jgi:tellurite resistance protein